MKNRFRVLSQVFLLLFLFSGCSEEGQRSSTAAKVDLGANPASTIREIFGEPDRFVRTERLIAALRAVPADQTSAFEEALNGLKLRNREFERVLVVTAWAQRDAPAATRWAKHHERDEVVRSAMFAESVYVWAYEDHESFLADMEMALYMLPGIDESLLHALLRGWFDSGEPNLEMYVRDMTPQSMDRQRAIEVLVRLMIERDGAAATVEWAKALPGDVTFRKIVYSRAAGQVVTIDSKLAVDWCAEVCDSPLGSEMPHMIALRWANKAGEEAMDFITSLPNAVGVRTGARAAYRRFLITEPDRASAWIEKLTEEQRRKPVMQGLVGMHVNKLSGQGRPLLAIEWLAYIKNEDERASRLQPITRRWLLQDRQAAEAWMAESSMPEEAKRQARQSAVRPSSGKNRLR